MLKYRVAGKWCKGAWLIAWAQCVAMAGVAPAGAQDTEAVRQETSGGQGDDGVDEERVAAHDEEARARFSAARLAYADGRFDDALEDFKRAYQLSGRPALLFNIASASDRLRRDQDALEAYEGYLAKVPDVDNRRFVESRIALLRERVADEEQRAAERAVPTPEQAAAGAPPGVGAPAGDEARDTGERRVVSRWWFWTGVAAVVVAGVLTGVLVSRSSSSSDPFVGSDGQAHETLSVGRW
jgi:tetratricopeptide (TPR) repeat protein